jgi:hypothetical protein
MGDVKGAPFEILIPLGTAATNLQNSAQRTEPGADFAAPDQLS